MPTSCDCVSFFFQAEDGIRDGTVTGVQTCALPISAGAKELTRLHGKSGCTAKQAARSAGAAAEPVAPQLHATSHNSTRHDRVAYLLLTAWVKRNPMSDAVASPPLRA